MALAVELTQKELEELFAKLAEQWHDETGGHSLTHRIVNHPAYLKIIGLGPRAIPLIIEDLRATGGFWFVALEALTRENPTIGIDPSKPGELAAAWLAWADAQGPRPG